MRLSRLLTIALGGLLMAGLVTAVAAANTVPTSHAGRVNSAITANSLKPPECAALTLTAIVTGSGTFSGTNANELILGSAGNDTISGGAGADCILGGGGNDNLNGGAGNDVLLGGAGVDALTGGGGTDVCYGGGQVGDSQSSCATWIP